MDQLTDRELRALVAHASGNLQAASQTELRRRVVDQLLRRKVRLTGICSAGHAVYLDDIGAMSTGYVGHASGHSVCEHGGEIWDATPLKQRKRIYALLRELREAGL